MTWRRQSTSDSHYVEVSLDEWDTAQLLQELINRKVIDEAMAAILLRREAVECAVVDQSELDEAQAELFRGRRREALVHLERALGRSWIGRLHADH